MGSLVSSCWFCLAPRHLSGVDWVAQACGRGCCKRDPRGTGLRPARRPLASQIPCCAFQSVFLNPRPYSLHPKPSTKTSKSCKHPGLLVADGSNLLRGTVASAQRLSETLPPSGNHDGGVGEVPLNPSQQLPKTSQKPPSQHPSTLGFWAQRLGACGPRTWAAAQSCGGPSWTRGPELHQDLTVGG